MSSIEIINAGQGALVLRAKNSELLILPQYVKELRLKTDPKEFSDYFSSVALVNRPARKLFLAWLRKDRTIWPRLFKMIHEEIKDEDFDQTPDGVANITKPAEDQGDTSEKKPQEAVE